MFSNTTHDREGAIHDTTYLKQLLSFHGFQVQSEDNDQTEEVSFLFTYFHHTDFISVLYFCKVFFIN